MGIIECIICREMRRGSKEHIIPEAIGGRLITRKVCNTCNNNCCAKLDAALADDRVMLHARNRFKIPGYEDVVDKVLGPGEFEDGTKVVVNFDEKNEVFTPRVLGGKNIRDNDDGTKTITWSFPEMPQPNDLLVIARKELARHGEVGLSDSDVLARISSREVAMENPSVKFQYRMDLYGRALAGLKIAYEFTAETLGDSYLSDAYADEARRLIMAGVPTGEAARGAFAYEGGCLAEIPNMAPYPTHKLVLFRRADTLLVVMLFFGTFAGQYKVSGSASRYEPFAMRAYALNIATGIENEYWVPSRS
jgi:hypothetical protein